jgi:hypothetical protein
MAGKRWQIRFRKRLSLLIALLLTVIIAFWFLKRSSFLPYQFTKFVNENYLQDSPFHFSCKKVSGNLINQVVIESIVLEYADGNDRFTLFESDRISLNYQLMQLLKLRMVIDELALDNVRIQVEQDEEGRLIIPAPGMVVESGSKSVSPHIDVKRFLVHGMQLSFSGGSRQLRVKNVSVIGSMQYLDNKGTLRIDNGSGYLIDSETSIGSLRTSLDFDGKNIDLNEFVVRLNRSYIMATGGYQGDELKRLQFVFNPVDLAELSEMGIYLGDEGELAGNIILEGPLDSLAMNGSLTGHGWGLTFGGVSFEGTFSGDDLLFTKVQGDIFGNYLDGKFSYKLGEAGEFSYRGLCRDLDLSQGFIPGGVAPETALSGEIQVAHRRTEGSYVFQANLNSAVVNGFASENLRLRGRWVDDVGLEFEEAEFTRPGFVLSTSGTIDANSQVDMLFDVAGDSLDYLWDYLSLPQFGGSMGVSGRLFGPADRMTVNLNGRFRDVSYLFASIDSGTVQAQIDDVPDKMLRARVDLQGRRLLLGDRKFDSPHILLEAGSGKTTVRDFSFARGDTVVSMDFDIIAGNDQSTISFKHVSIITPEEEWKALQPIQLDLTDNGATIDSVLISSPRGSIGLLGSYAKDTDVCRLVGWGENIDLSLFKDAFDFPFLFHGRSRFNLSVRGAIDNPQIVTTLNLQKGAIDSLVFDNLDLQAGYTPSDGYRLDRLIVVSDGDSLVSSGRWRLTRSPIRLIRDGDDSEDIFDNPFQLQLQSMHFPLQDITRAVHSHLRPSGRFSGNVIFENTPHNPVVRLAGTLSGAEKADVSLPPIAIELNYQDSLLTLEKAQFDDGKTRGTMSGSIPLGLSLFEGVRMSEKSQVDVNGTFMSDDLSPLAAYWDRIAMLGGTMTGKMNIAGTMNHPSILGDVSFQNCRLRLSGMEEVYESIDARIEFHNNQIRLVSLAGKEGKKGSFQGSGSAELDGFTLDNYRVTFDFSEFELVSIYDFNSTQSGRVELVSHKREDGKVIPKIEGNVAIKEAQILRLLGESAGGGSASGPTASPGWLCDLDITAEKNVWVRNPDITMELGGEVVLKRDEHGLYLRGQMQVLKGSYKIYNNKFHLTDGTFDFSKTNSLRPEMYLNAYTPYRREGDREHRIYLNLSWPSDKQEPEASLSFDEPGYSETDIWKMLGGTYVSPTASEGGDSWDAAGAAQGIATNYLERMLNAQMTDVTIDVESRAPGGRSFSSTGEREMSIAIGKYLSDDLYLRYRQGISIRSDQEVDIEYRISNMVIIRSEIIRHSDKMFLGQRKQATDEINLDIKLRWEY